MTNPDAAPRWLVWPTVGGAVVLTIVAFLLWGFGGAGALFDMIAAWCA